MSESVHAALDRAGRLEAQGDREGAINVLHDALNALAVEIADSEQRWAGFGGVFDAAYAAKVEFDALRTQQQAVYSALGELCRRAGRAAEAEDAFRLAEQLQTDTDESRALAAHARARLRKPEPAPSEPRVKDEPQPPRRRGFPFKERLEAAARQWAQAGRSPDGLLAGDMVFLANCWVLKLRRSRPDVLTARLLIEEYVAASVERLGGEVWWNGLMEVHEYCSIRCGMRWRLENLSQCVECLRYVCYQCEREHARQCGGELVG